MPSIHVSIVADSMIYDAEGDGIRAGESPKLFRNEQMFELSKRRKEEENTKDEGNLKEEDQK